MSYVIAIAVAFFAAFVAGLLALPEALGAHPWWSAKVLWTGGSVGVALGILTAWGVSSRSNYRGVALIGLVVATIAAFATARYGQTQFAASYAEDAFAGKLWFFGWHSTCAFTMATLTLVAWIIADKLRSRA